MRYRPDLDGIRALAVLAVLASHANLRLTVGGWMGVDIFFVLSGYLITTLLLAEHAKTGSLAVGRFYARRALRLYPALIVLVLVGGAFYRDLGDDGTALGYLRTAASSAFYVEDFVYGFTGLPHGAFGHTWSLGVEEQFYLLWPILLLWLLKSGRDPLRWAAALALISWATLVPTGLVNGASGTAPDGYFLPWSRFFELLLGCCVAFVLARGSAPRWLSHRAVGWSLAAAAALLMISGPYTHLAPDVIWAAPAIAFVTAAMIAHLDGTPDGIRRLLGSAPLAYLGRRSYGVYLYHAPIFHLLLPRLHVERHVADLICILAAIAVAIASYRFVELPFLRLKHRRFEPPSHRPEPVPT